MQYLQETAGFALTRIIGYQVANTTFRMPLNPNAFAIYTVTQTAILEAGYRLGSLCVEEYLQGKNLQLIDTSLKVLTVGGSILTGKKIAEVLTSSEMSYKTILVAEAVALVAQAAFLYINLLNDI
jgi:hypothetical protein